jgi:diguanylate cyclase (GGDEF)-like protein
LAERKIVDAKLKYLVMHDELTGLINRHNFESQLRIILSRSRMRQQEGALIFINLDRFSLVNELEGFDVGDRLLIEVVGIIRKLTLKDDLFARIGSDEFCLFLDNSTEKEIKQFAERVRKSVYEFIFSCGDVCYSTSLSIGIAPVTANQHPNEAISRARQACRMAKEHGRNMLWFYNEMDTKVQERNKDLYWVPLIKKALLDKKFFLVFQPVVCLNNGEISHYEVLIRMRGLQNEVISPGDFIPVSERMGLIHDIDQWVVENAIDFLAKLPESSNVSLAINLSSVAFQDDSLLPTLKEKLSISWVDASRLMFEITETAAVANFEQTRKMIAEIRSLGCQFALDDFGAGFCSFNYLKTFPVDFVKIDGQFIRNLINDETDQVLVKSMAEIATNLGKKTIAEFVETPEIIVKLKELGIDMAQGYIFGRPEQELLASNSIALDRIAREITKPKRFASWFSEKVSWVD